MTNETINTIKSAIKAVATDLGLSNYKRLQIQKSEIAAPAGWGSSPDADNSDDACIQRYYRAIEAVFSGHVSASAYTNLYMDFKDRLACRYGIYV